MAFKPLIGLSLLLLSEAAFSEIPSADQLVKPMKLSAETVERTKDLELAAQGKVVGVEQLITSPQFRARIDKHINGTASQLGIKGADSQKVLAGSNGPTFILFVSSSIPVETLRNYVNDLYRVDGIMVLRGMVGDESKMKPTIDFIRRLLVENTACTHSGCPVRKLKIAIDPARFAKHEIEQVPAGLIERSPSFEPNCNEGTKYQKVSETVVGDVSVEGMLKALDPKGSSAVVKTLLAKLEVKE